MTLLLSFPLPCRVRFPGIFQLSLPSYFFISSIPVPTMFSRFPASPCTGRLHAFPCSRCPSDTLRISCATRPPGTHFIPGPLANPPAPPRFYSPFQSFLTPVPFPCSLSLPSLHAGPAKAGPDATGRPYTVLALAGTRHRAANRRHHSAGRKKTRPPRGSFRSLTIYPPRKTPPPGIPGGGSCPARPYTVPPKNRAANWRHRTRRHRSGRASRRPGGCRAGTAPPPAFAAGGSAGGGTPCRQLAAPYRAADRRHRTRPPPETAKGRFAKDAHRRPQKPAPHAGAPPVGGAGMPPDPAVPAGTPSGVPCGIPLGMPPHPPSDVVPGDRPEPSHAANR